MNQQNGMGRNGAGRTRPRRLLLCLDGVPYDVVEAAKERGLFAGFGPPSRLLSPFPTLTNVALSTMLGATPPNGYESRYFDRANRELRGGVGKYIGRRTPDKLPSSYMDELDYQEPLAFEFLVYVAPEWIWRADMQRFRDRFRSATRTRDYFAFLKGTDGLLHIRGPGRLAVALESLDEILREIQGYCGSETEIVLFSDHGMNLRENRRAHLQTHLTRQGFKIVGQFRSVSRRAIAIPAFGLCGYAALYCGDEEAVPGLADALIDLEGVDFSVYRDSDSSVVVKGSSGTARIEQKGTARGTHYHYNQIEGDPLQLAAIMRGLSREGHFDPDGYALDRVWLERTANHVYPDSLANLYTSLHRNRVRHAADVLVSFRDGYYFGWSAFDHIVRLAATHGNSLRGSTSAFMMSTHRILPEYVRADDAQPLLKE
jgi:hypothetical protein